jgi:hypothetical protein
MLTRKQALISLAVIFIAVLLLASFRLEEIRTNRPNEVVLNYNLYGTIWVKKNNQLIYYSSGLDPLTNLGFNLTFAKLSGSNSYNLTTYNLNATIVSLGNYTGTNLNSSSTILQGEFIRNSTTIHAQVYNGYNLTALFNGFSGSNSSNCMGINYNGVALGNQDLFAYTTFNLITGIDSTFSITCELQISGTTS